MRRQGNHKYLHDHPELKVITTSLISEVIYAQPKDILRFAAAFFRSPDLQDHVARTLGYRDKDAHVTAIKRAALNSPSSDLSEPEPDAAASHRRTHGSRTSHSTGYILSSVDNAYRCLLNLSAKLGEARRKFTSFKSDSKGDSAHTSMQADGLVDAIDATGQLPDKLLEKLPDISLHNSLPSELMADVLTSDVQEILLCAKGIQQLLGTLPETLDTRRAAHLLKHLIDLFGDDIVLEGTVEGEVAPDISVTLDRLLPLIDNKLWGNLSDAGREAIEISSIQLLTKPQQPEKDKTRLSTGESLATTTSRDSTNRMSQSSRRSKQINLHRPGLFLDDYIISSSAPDKFTDRLTPRSARGSLSRRDPTQTPTQADKETTSPNQASYKVAPTYKFLSAMATCYDRLEELPFTDLELSSAIRTQTAILVQHPLSHFLAYPLMASIVTYLHTCLSSCLFVSRGGLLQWLSLFGFWQYVFTEPSVEKVLSTQLTRPNTFKASPKKSPVSIFGTSQSLGINNSGISSLASTNPMNGMSGRVRFNDLLSMMESAPNQGDTVADILGSPGANVNDAQIDDQSNTPGMFTTLTQQQALSPQIRPISQEWTQISQPKRLIYEVIDPDLLTFLRTVAPHISGIGAEEYEFGILDICMLLPQTYFCCANLEIEEIRGSMAGANKLELQGTAEKLDVSRVYTGTLHPSLPFTYLYSIASIFPELGFGQFKVFKFLPVIMRAKHLGDEHKDICVVYTSILPTTYCDTVVPGEQLCMNLDRLTESQKRDRETKPPIAAISSNYTCFATAPSAGMLEDISSRVQNMIEQANITVSAIRYVVLSATTSYGRSAADVSDAGNFLSNSWINTGVVPHSETPNFMTRNILCYHEFMNEAYNTPEYVQSLHNATDYLHMTIPDVSIATVYTLHDMVEESYVGPMLLKENIAIGNGSALSRPHKQLSPKYLITKSLFKDCIDYLQPHYMFIKKDVLPKLPLVANKLLYRDLLNCKIFPWLFPTRYVSFIGKTRHTPIFCYLAHKLRDCACYFLPLVTSHRAAINEKKRRKEGEKKEDNVHAEAEAEQSISPLDHRLTKDLITRLKNRTTDNKLVPSTSIDFVACFSARILAGGSPSYSHNDVHHDSTACMGSGKDCSTSMLKDTIYTSQSLLYPESTVASFMATFPSLFSAEAKLYLGHMTLTTLFDALYYTYTTVFGELKCSVHVVSDSLPYLTNVGMYCDTSDNGKQASFLFNLEKMGYELSSQLKYSIARDTIVSKETENINHLTNDRVILDLVKKHRLTAEDMERDVLVLVDEYMLHSPIGISRKALGTMAVWRWMPMVVPLQNRHYNQIEERYEFDESKTPIDLHLTAGHALIGRYYPGFDPNRGVMAMEDHMRRSIYSLPFHVVTPANLHSWHLLDRLH